MRRLFLCATALALAALPTPAAPRVAQDGRGLEAGLDAIRAERIRPDLVFFADDEMRGRDTPSAELRVAARFLRARLERLGFTPAGTGGDWFHTYGVNSKRIDVERSKAVAIGARERVEFTFGRDYFVYSLKHVFEHELSGPVVFCGGGGKDELKGLELDGRWALCVDDGESASRRARYVERAGAGGLIVLPDMRAGEDTFVARLARTSEAALAGSVSRSTREREAPLPAVYLSLDAASRLRSLAGIDVADGRATWPALGTQLGVEFVERRAGGGVETVENVCALWPGVDPELARDVIIVSAHYDHVGAKGERVWNGADDNASGSMGLLALAEALRAYGPLRRSVLLLWVSGEEKGLWGSAAWTREPTLPEGMRAVCDLNIDMIGRNAPDSLLITPTAAHPAYNGLTRIAEELAPLEGFPVLGNCDPYWERSDHKNFADQLDIPVAFLFSDVHADYHQETDTADKIDYDKIRRVTRLVLRMLDALQTDDLDL